MSFLYPGEYIDSTYSIDFDKLYNEGYRGIIFDIDNTLVTHGSPADERAIALFKHLKELGFSCLVLSNNKEPRVKSFAKQLGIKYIYKAGKPKPSLSYSNGEAWYRYEKHSFCGRSDIYGYHRSQSYGYQINTCSTY